MGGIQIHDIHISGYLNYSYVHYISLLYPYVFHKQNLFKFQFINETVRLANIVPGIFRKALKDIQFKGM